MPSKGECIMDDIKYTELAVKLQETEDRSKSNMRRIEEHDAMLKAVQEDSKLLIKLTSSVETIANSLLDVNNKVDSIGEKQDKLSEQVTILENRPANEIKNRYNDIIGKLEWLFVGGIAGWILYQILPMINW
jgi:predicted nuclease with TOPRIM domain